MKSSVAIRRSTSQRLGIKKPSSLSPQTRQDIRLSKAGRSTSLPLKLLPLPPGMSLQSNHSSQLLSTCLSPVFERGFFCSIDTVRSTDGARWARNLADLNPRCRNFTGEFKGGFTTTPDPNQYKSITLHC